MNLDSDARICLDPFETAGCPVHCRTLVTEVLHDAAGRIRALATITDLRKQGWIPTGGELQTAGFIHDMSLDALVDARTRRIERFAPSQHVVAFEPGERAAGGSCRDQIHLLRGMVGETLEAGNARRLGEIFGGPLGCSHLLTLAQLVVSFLPAVLERESKSALGREHGREAGERIAKRAIVIDGFERRGRSMEVAIQLTDVHTRPFSGMSSVLDRLGAQHEVRAIVRVDTGSMTVDGFDAAERLRSRTDLGMATWQSRREELGWLAGHAVMRGLAPALLRRYGADPAREPLLAALVNFAPAFVQCLSARVTRMMEQPAGEGGRHGIPNETGFGGIPDSCYIWRRDG